MSTVQQPNPAFTQDSMTALNYAINEAMMRGHEYVTTEHVMLGLLMNNSVSNFLHVLKIDVDELLKDVISLVNSRTDLIRKDSLFGGDMPKKTKGLRRIMQTATTQTLMAQRLDVRPIDILGAVLQEKKSPTFSIISKYIDMNDLEKKVNREIIPDSMRKPEGDEVLDKFCTNLNKQAKEGKITPLVGREAELIQLQQILARKTKSNAVVVAEPGVGKTQLIEGLAQSIVDKRCSDTLFDKVIYTLNVGAMVAGTRHRGDFEERVTQVIDAVKAAGNIIMFIDEIHMVMGAGASSGQPDNMANLIKPALSKGEFQVIGATTDDEYRKHFEKDRAMMRRFHRMDLVEPTPAEAKIILKGLKKTFEDFHKIKYAPGAIETAVDLSVKYINGKALPDKAIDIIDAAAARQRIKAEADRVKAISKKEIEHEVSIIARIKFEDTKRNENDDLKNLEKKLHERVFGQNDALETLANSVFISKSGLRDKDKTQLAVLFAGYSGTGKTESAKTLASVLNIPLIRFDMSEYSEEHSVAKLIGSPPGYVGYGDGQSGSGILINEIEKNPRCVLLLDEIEKAHPKVHNMFLQIMDNGIITSSNGKTVSMKNVILIMTSNAGAREQSANAIGFGNLERMSEGRNLEAINQMFSPEFRNRLDAIITFNSLSKESMAKIVDKFIGQLVEQLKARKIKLLLSDEAKDWLADKGYDRILGARPLARVIEEHIKRPLSRMIIMDSIDKGVVSVNVMDGKLNLEVLESEEAEKELVTKEA